MKKTLLVLAGMLLMSGFAYSQALFTFDKDLNGFSVPDWSSKGVVSCKQVTDPKDATNGCVEVQFDGSKGTFDLASSSFDAKGPIITAYIWLPKDAPDTMTVRIWAQDKGSWSWNEVAYKAKDIAKEVWFPLTFNAEQRRLVPANKFDNVTNQFGALGVGVYGTNWAGTFYIDNVTMKGAKPIVLGDFETGLLPFDSAPLWGKGLAVANVANPSGTGKSVEISATAPADGAVGSGSAVDAKAGDLLTYYIYIPADAAISDSLQMGLFAQDNVNWGWDASSFKLNTIPKGVWYPVYFDMEATRLKDAKFDNVKNKLGKYGIQIYGDKTFTGKIYVDNLQLLNKDVSEKYVIANFNPVAGGIQKFLIPTFGPAATSLARVDDGTNSGNGVLEVSSDMSKGNWAIEKDDINLYNSIKDAIADSVTVDVLVPADFPTSDMGIVMQEKAGNYSWCQLGKTISATGDIVPGKWSTISWKPNTFMDTISSIKSKFQFYLQISSITGSTYTGKIQIDNLTIYGIPQPDAPVVSPPITVSVDSSKAPGDKFKYTRINWVDNAKDGGETYNIYCSKNPITDLASADVKAIAESVPRGCQIWAHRPYTNAGEDQTYYYAVVALTADATETPLTDQCKAGPFTLKSSKTVKVQYVKDFATKFNLDGQGDEWTNYQVNELVPESAAGNRSAGWTLSSKDMNYKTTFVIDDKYLYILAEVIDDNLNTSVFSQAWQGDALEFFLGFYNAAALKAPHAKSAGHSSGNWRIGFAVTGDLCLEGGTKGTVPGTEFVSYPDMSGKSYNIEAKLCLDSLAEGNKFKLANGMFMPCRIDGNDMDPLKIDVTTGIAEASRNLLVQFGGWDYFSQNKLIDLDQHWNRSSTYGMLEVVGAPTDVKTVSTKPIEFKLYNNYPNPFNPSTVIKYDLPKETQVALKVYDMLGRQVASLVNTKQTAGHHEVSFNASALSSGVYIYKIEAGSFNATKKMMLIK
jgi:hypothetical protein